MQLFNALSQNLERFEPESDTVTVYVCGITPYDTTHIGHGFTYASFDMLIRYLVYLGFHVRYAQNVTDIDDDILRRAAQVGEDWWSLGNQWTTHFIDDNLALNFRPPEYFPRATDVIEEIISTVQTLIHVGVAYESNGSVYFNVAKDEEYGKLSGLTFEEMLPIANERGNNPDDPQKINKLDFVLWQAQAEGEPIYDPDIVTIHPERFLAAERIREKILERTRQELPFATAVLIDRYEEQPHVIRIYASVIVERPGQKKILIGHGGRQIKAIGTAARRDLEEYLEQKVFLDLKVRVEKSWRENRRILSDLDRAPFDVTLPVDSFPLSPREG